MFGVDDIYILFKYQNILQIRLYKFIGPKESRFINLIMKESLNHDGQQFHQFQQNEKLPITSKRPLHMHM